MTVLTLARSKSFAAAARKGLGLPDAPYYVSAEVQSYFAEHKKKQNAGYEAWLSTF